jgi:hypothetical protein
MRIDADAGRQIGLDAAAAQHPEARLDPGCHQHGRQLRAHAFTRHATQGPADARHRRLDRCIRLEVQRGHEPGGPQRAQGILAKTLWSGTDRAQTAQTEIPHASERIDELSFHRIPRHRVDREVPLGQVVLQARPSAEGGDVHGSGRCRNHHRSVSETDGDRALEDLEHDFGRRRRADVEVGRRTAEQQLAHASAYEQCLVTSLPQALHQRADRLGHRILGQLSRPERNLGHRSQSSPDSTSGQTAAASARGNSCASQSVLDPRSRLARLADTRHPAAATHTL